MATSQIAIILPGTTGSSLVDWGTLSKAYQNQSKTPVTSAIATPTWPTLIESELVLAEAEMKSSNAKVRLAGEILLGVAEAQITQAGASSATQAPTSDSTLVPYQPTAAYQTLISSLQSQLNGAPYVLWNLGLSQLPGSGNAVIGFGYDWRQSNTFSAQCLQTLLHAIDTAWGSDYEVVLVAHSMGGLVSRAYIENVGAKDPWIGNLKALITFGTPHLGAPLALDAALSQSIVSMLDPAFVDTLIDNTSFPSTYQLLPPSSQAFVTNTSTKALDDIYSGALNSAVAASAVAPVTPAEITANLSEAAGFFQTLDYSAGGKDAVVPYYVIWGICNEATPLNSSGDTVTSFTWSGNQQSPDFTAGWSAASGDGVVPAGSAQFTTTTVAGSYQALYATAQAQASKTVSVNHFQLVSSPDALNQMSGWITTIFG